MINATIGLLLCLLFCQCESQNDKVIETETAKEMEAYESEVDSLAKRIILLCYEHRSEYCDTMLIDSIGNLALDIFDAGNAPTDFLEESIE